MQRGRCVFAIYAVLQSNLKRLDRIQNDTKIADYMQKCSHNKEKIVKANGGMCDVVKELLGSYLKGGMYLDDESFRLIQFHIYECDNCQNEVVTYNSVHEEIYCDFASFEDDCLQEFIISTNKCLFFRKNRNAVVTDQCGEKVYEKFLQHCNNCIECKDYFIKYIELVYLVHMGLLMDIDLGSCYVFNIYREFLRKGLLAGKHATMLNHHYLLCDHCNNVYINSWTGYAKRCNIDDRSDKI